LAVLLKGGIPIIRALTVVSSVINNTNTRPSFAGGGRSQDRRPDERCLRKFPLVPPSFPRWSDREESGQVDTVLEHIAHFYEQETDQMTKNLSTLIEPILMVIIGIAVGFLAFASSCDLQHCRAIIGDK